MLILGFVEALIENIMVSGLVNPCPWKNKIWKVDEK